MAAKRWVKWEWSHAEGKPVRTVLQPTELKAKGIHNPAAGFVKEGSKEEFFQKELAGQLDLFDLQAA
ncbi:hypothetical protein E0H39_29550 [Rhizobium leguminosarum bv. viciae]|uniref:hypothetical protein n=1 Tax=Rhizobium leguminosarum TaxID=384 RepID=UPI00103DFDAB|nr:hypothetical protein [Rhizobium leguminosarum]TBY57965.1 hypothetical protein E0H39_29550 [Rhizobium leguminosarum bv. viciae]